jgi:hypothetical protein
MNKIKVNKTETYKDENGIHTVCKAKLVFIKCDIKGSLICGVRNKVPNGKYIYFTEDMRLGTSQDVDFFKPIIISETDQQDSLSKGDNILFNGSDGRQAIYKYLECDGYGMGVLDSNKNRCTVAYSHTARILALSEQFSPEILKDITDGKLKNGDDVYILCEINPDLNEDSEAKVSKSNNAIFIPNHNIKINIEIKNNYVTVFPVNKEDGWYDVIENIIDAMSPAYNISDFIKILRRNYNPPTRKK